MAKSHNCLTKRSFTRRFLRNSAPGPWVAQHHDVVALLLLVVVAVFKSTPILMFQAPGCRSRMNPLLPASHVSSFSRHFARQCGAFLARAPSSRLPRFFCRCAKRTIMKRTQKSDVMATMYWGAAARSVFSWHDRPGRPACPVSGMPAIQCTP